MQIKLLIIVLLFNFNIYAQEKLRVGVLAYGTVNWELEVLKNNALDKKNDFELEVVKLASKNAVAIALQSKTVDIIVSDWVWVNRQKANGKHMSFYPYSKAIGALYIQNNENIKTLLDLKDKYIGIAGGSVDKTWILFQAYSKYKYNQDLKNIINEIYAAPPILYKKVSDKSIFGAMNFWHYNAKLDKNNIKRLIGVEEIFKEFDIKNDIPLVGWIFDTNFANKNPKLINNFLQASYESKKLLLDSSLQWDKIRPLMKAKNDSEFDSLKEGYKKGIVKDYSQENIKSASKVFEILYKEGGEKLVGKSKTLNEDIFWNFSPNIKW
ncbi:MAG: ABC transporter substrate-binding protein [Poseidonibacter sp.]|uniref:ABC transporter substrate-binding protein n=1 Tax=Poseidonibacter sp. TaxID=2321188 RepID=UPI00359D1524